MSETKVAASAYNKNNPFLGKITENFLLTKAGSEKETRHLVVNISGSNLQYLPGYSLGVFPKNPPSLAAEILERLHLDPSHPVAQKDGSTKPLLQTLMEDHTLNRAGKKFVRAVAEKIQAGAAKDGLSALVANEEELETYVHTRDYIDILNEFPEVRFTAEELLENIGRLVPRLYSIASSQAKHPDEIHLTVAIVRYTTHHREKKGLCSGFLADHTELNLGNLPVFLAPNKHFKLPDDKQTPIIMVGPGTGIAPFRAFLEQRETEGATGRNWLYFGDQRKASDFLYEDEFNNWLKKGLLTRFDTAFSRDQAHKVYVQDRMHENGAELWKWLQEGAYLYVCGDAKRMAKDVHETLIQIAVQHGGLAYEKAEEYIGKTLMKDEKRYLRDVY